jgi:long-chain acyl-CoA synthetase
MLVGALPFRAFRDMFFVGAAEYFETPVMRWLARTLNVVPVDPDANLVKAMQAGAHGLRLGKVLVLFPEGERSIDGTVKEFRKGAAILSHHAGAPIVPVALDGAWDVWARGVNINWRAVLPWSRTRARLEFAAPLDPPPAPDYASHTEELRNRVMSVWTRLHAERRG